MPTKKIIKTKKGKVAPLPSGVKKGPTTKKQSNPLFEKRTRNFGIGQDIQPKRDLTRFVRWPKYVRLQRQRAVLKKRLKVPPSIAQFTRTFDKNNADALYRLLAKYRPESREAKKKRLVEVAKARAAEEKAGKKAAAAEKKSPEKPVLVKFGINHVTTLIEQRKAKLVVIAHDVDPIEIVVWLPALCRKMEIPYCIVKSKARLGTVVHKKTATALAITEVKPEDAAKLEQIVAAAKVHYNDDTTALRRWGGGILGSKAQAVVRRREKAVARDAAKKAGQ